MFADLCHHVQAQLICNMIISLIHIALIKILCSNILESSVTYKRVLIIPIPIISPLAAFNPREVLLREITLYAKLQNYHFIRILEFMLILLINGLNYQGRYIHSIVCQVSCGQSQIYKSSPITVWRTSVWSHKELLKEISQSNPV